MAAKQERTLSSWFGRFAAGVAFQTGRPLVFALATLSIVVWAVCGPAMGFSEVWQLTINTGTTIVTFLMVFLIQNTQNRDSSAMHLKLDELIRVTEKAHNSLLALEELSPEELERRRKIYLRLAERDSRRQPSATPRPEPAPAPAADGR